MKVENHSISLPDTPPSFNKVGHTGNRWAWTRAKKEWQQTIEIALMAEAVPRDWDTIKAHAILRFPTRRRRDEGNYRTLLEKCLGDALVNGRWIKDDTPQFFEFGSVQFAAQPGEALTMLLLTCTAT